MSMEGDAARVLDEEVLAGAVVSTRGTTGRIAAGAAAAGAMNLGGVVGAAAARLGAEASAARAPKVTTPGDHQGFVFVAVGPAKVGFFEMKRGFLGNSLGRVLTVVRRSDLVRFAVDDKGVAASALDVELKDGTVFALEVARLNRGKVGRVQEVLGL